MQIRMRVRSRPDSNPEMLILLVALWVTYVVKRVGNGHVYPAMNVSIMSVYIVDSTCHENE